ncbi:hypothetical protein KZJ38_10700 [Paraburkholderia edwinii]|uniref:Uncharacterized protein n=1 Tax=Paraburkholderia edwinii TaxID=2861782 RepID=A0ABX8UU03_9BURK|nr:hypothetical protein [Paraburkholderia edwinii]QYD70700.1 hypothetical protein KZJ38_10700 [Paraburkholderia edwinii]
MRATAHKNPAAPVFIRAGMHWRIGEYPRTSMNKEALKFLPQVSKKNNLYRKLFPDFFLISAATITSFGSLETGFHRYPAGLLGISYITFNRLLYSCIRNLSCTPEQHFINSHIYLIFLSGSDLNLSQFHAEKSLEKFAAN